MRGLTPCHTDTTTRGIQRGIITGLGLQSYMAAAMIVSLWVVGLALMRFLAFRRHHGLLGIWESMPASYVLLNVGLALAYTLHDWTAISRQISGRAPDIPAETHPMLSGADAEEGMDRSVEKQA